MSIYQAKDWHEGELEMHRRLRVSDHDNPAVPGLSPQLANMLQRAPLLAFGTLDAEGNPWTTLWGGEKGFSQPIASDMIGIRTPVPHTLDPVVEILVGKDVDGEVVKEEHGGRLISGLSIDLITRKRVKLAGRMVAGALGSSSQHNDGSVGDEGRMGSASLQLVVKIEESLGNCPKYLNKRRISPARSAPQLGSEGLPLTQEAVDLIYRSDVFFLSTTHSGHDMDTNHRGGPRGFVRISENGDEVVLVYPEYSGNRLYQTLGNLITNSKIGCCFPDFENGHCLFLTGTADILVGKNAAEFIVKSNLAVKITVTSARFVKSILPFRGKEVEFSPYNPIVRPLATEKGITLQNGKEQNRAKLLEQIPLTHDISRFRFGLSNPVTYHAGQFVTLDFSDHLDLGYSHMRDDDPRSLNDDFVRTFTVSSPPGLPPRPSERLDDDEFEITIRRVGVVTDYLFKHGIVDSRSSEEIELGVRGFGGTFQVEQLGDSSTIAFIAAGIGITPLLPSLSKLNFQRLRLLWTIRAKNVRLAVDILETNPGLLDCTQLFVTSLGPEEDEIGIQKLSSTGFRIERRRMAQDDVQILVEHVERWYVCTGVAHREVILLWLSARDVMYEDYNF